MQQTRIAYLEKTKPHFLLWAIVLLAVIARVASALYQGNEVQALPGLADQISYHKLALRVLAGHGFSFDVGWWPATPAGQPTAHWSYLYVLFLAAVYFILGPNALAARLVQAILVGVLQPLLTWRLSHRLFGPRVGLISTLIASVYVYFIYYGGALMTESFYILAILWILDLATALAENSDQLSHAGKWVYWAQMGLAFGLAVLLRQVFLLLIPAILLWLAFKTVRQSRLLSPARFLKCSTVALIILAACVVPWTIRNYKVFHSFVLLNTNSGFAFFWGNHPIHGDRFIPILSSEEYGALIPSELRVLDEARLDKALLLRGIDFVRHDPVRYLLLSTSRAKEYFRFWPAYDSGKILDYLRLLSSGPLFVLLLAAFCLLSSQAGRRKNFSIHSGTSLLLLTGLLYTVLHLMTWTLIRYRLPVDAILIPFSGIIIVYGWDSLRHCFKKQKSVQMTKTALNDL